MENNKIISDTHEITNKFNHFFINIGPKLVDSIHGPPNMDFKKYLTKKFNHTFKFHSISCNDVEKIIDKLKSKSSTGYDEMSTKLLKILKTVLISPITTIINQSFKNGIFPALLKIAKVIPLFKADNDTLFTNYRPISLLPSISKIFEKAMALQIMEYFKINKLFYPNQYGFREDHSTELASLELVDNILNEFENKNCPLSTFLDLSKAFDTLNHDILLHKLNYYGFENKSSDLILSYLTNRLQYVDINGTKSEQLSIKTGVPQGSILGPLLFIIYINDLAHANSHFRILMYADDTTLTTTLQTRPNSSTPINEALSDVNIWLQLNKLSLNTKKTKYMIFHHPNKKFIEPNLSINETTIERVNTFNFLGLTLDENLNWKAHINKISNKISRAIGIMNKLKHILPLNIKLTLYNTLILPHINYNIMVWGNHTDKIFKQQKKSLRIITCSKYNCHTNPIFKDLKILKVQDILYQKILKFYFKLKNDSLPRSFNYLTLTHSYDIHDHDTRANTLLTVPLFKYSSSQQCLSYKVVTTVNKSEKCIIDKITTHSLNGFSNYIKFMYTNYNTECHITNCYICNKP